jgi:hypothetical protein
MSDPLSITASVVAVATLAYNSSKALYEITKDIKDAPKTFLDLKTDLEALQSVLNSLKTELNRKDRATALSEAQRSVLEELELPLRSCSDACDEFKSKLAKLLSRSGDGHTSFRDKVKLQFQDKEVSAFRFRLASYKSTLTIALSFSSL